MPLAVHYPGAVKINDLKGKIVHIPALESISWQVGYHSVGASNRVELKSIPNGNVSEVSWGCLKGAIERGEIRVREE